VGWTGGGSYGSRNSATNADCLAQWSCNDAAAIEEPFAHASSPSISRSSAAPSMRMER